jgi:hypothetical protein
MSFSRDCPVAFRWLTGLSLTSLKFRDYDFPSLIGACDKLKSLSLRSCGLVPRSAALKIDAPNSAITELEFIRCKFSQIDLVSVPKLTQLRCHRWRSKNPPLRFGYVPELQKVRIACRARTWQPPFALSACFSMNTRNLSKLHLNFGCQMVTYFLGPHAYSRSHLSILRRFLCICVLPLAADLDSAGATSEAAHCYIQQPDGYDVLEYLS